MPVKSLGEAVQEICLKTEPKPLYCELPDDLKIKTYYTFGTASNASLSSVTDSVGSIFKTTTL